MQKISPFFWFDKEAEEAANFYVEVFNGNPGKKRGAKIGAVGKYDEAGSKAAGQPVGSVMTISFTLEGMEFTALNGGPQFKMSGAVSFVVLCETQNEVDYFWRRLGEEGGEPGVCGWINKDKFGVTWQIVPGVLTKLLSDPDPKKAQRAMKAMLKMTKLDIAELKNAANSS